jgi:hypothetical protein
VSLAAEPRVIADPFHHTAELVALLRERADRLAARQQQRATAVPVLAVAES